MNQTVMNISCQCVKFTVAHSQIFRKTIELIKQFHNCLRWLICSDFFLCSLASCWAVSNTFDRFDLILTGLKRYMLHVKQQHYCYCYCGALVLMRIIWANFSPHFIAPSFWMHWHAIKMPILQVSVPIMCDSDSTKCIRKTVETTFLLLLHFIPWSVGIFSSISFIFFIRFFA